MSVDTISLAGEGRGGEGRGGILVVLPDNLEAQEVVDRYAGRLASVCHYYNWFLRKQLSFKQVAGSLWFSYEAQICIYRERET